MKFLAIILTLILVVYQVDASEEEGGDINIVIEQHVELPGPPDVDECFEDIDTCADNEVCVNNPRSYTCICADGYEKVKGTCEDVDECSKEVAVCGDFSECVNNVGSFSCKCAEGFEDVEGFCEDIDECSANENLCDYDNRECVNNVGNFTCNCNEGFEDVNDICIDIDECNADNICGYKEVCRNSIGSYTCICEFGYADIGNGCESCITTFSIDNKDPFEWTTLNYPDNYPEDIICGLNITISEVNVGVNDKEVYVLTWKVMEPGKIYDSSNNNDCTMSSDHLTAYNGGTKEEEICGDVETGDLWKSYGEKNKATLLTVLLHSNSEDGASAKGIKFEVEEEDETSNMYMLETSQPNPQVNQDQSEENTDQLENHQDRQSIEVGQLCEPSKV